MDKILLFLGVIALFVVGFWFEAVLIGVVASKFFGVDAPLSAGVAASLLLSSVAVRFRGSPRINF